MHKDANKTAYKARKKYKELDLGMTKEEYTECETDYLELSKQAKQLRDEVTTIKKSARNNTLTELTAIANEWVCGYLAYIPDDDTMATARNNTLGIDAESGEYISTPTDRQKANRNECEQEQFTAEQLEHCIEHIARVKAGQRAISRYIYHEKTKSADFQEFCISLDLFLEDGTDADGNKLYKMKTVKTKSFYEKCQADKGIIQALAKDCELTKKQSKGLLAFCEIDAIHEEQQARTNYIIEDERKAKESGNKPQRLKNPKRFKRLTEETGYKARKEYMFSKLDITKDNRKSEFMKDLKNKLEPRYRQIIELAKADAIQDKQQTPKPNRKKVIKKAGDQNGQQSKLVIVPSPHREPQAVAWITRAEHLEKLERQAEDKANRWSIADPTQEQAEQNANAYTERHKNDPQRTAETISGLSDKDKARYNQSMTERQALTKKMEQWENRHSK
jgi:hypothetical protein